MSIKIMQMVWESSVGPSPKRFALLALADIVNDEGVGWPSIPHLAMKTALGESTVRRALASLEDEGLVSYRRRFNSSNIYQINVAALRAMQTPCQSERTVPLGASGTTPVTASAPPVRASAPPSRSEHLTLIEPTKNQETSEAADAPADVAEQREDIEKLCSVLQSLMVDNGCRKPTITKKWRESARLLLDRDERPLEQALSVLAWSQRDTFWKKNVQSLPTFRDKYDRLRMAWEESGPVTAPRSNSEESIRDWLRAMWQEGTVTAIEERSGLRFPHPNLPDGIRTKEAAREFHVQARRDWITANADRIVSTILERAA